MSLTREQIEHIEYSIGKNKDKPWKDHSHSRKWLKRQMNKFLRLRGKNIEDDGIGGKIGKKPLKGYEY